MRNIGKRRSGMREFLKAKKNVEQFLDIEKENYQAVQKNKEMQDR